MGTRHLIAVKTDGEYRVAQYGQWDGYPSGQGTTVLEFLHNTNLEGFRNQVKKCRFITEEESESIDEMFSINWIEHYPQLSRGMGGKILSFVMDNKDNECLIVNSIEFAADSLFCEWVYVIDFDENTFEVYKGFVKEKHIIKERFSLLKTEKGSEYYPVKLLKKYSLDNLPTEENFLKDCGE
jgi:hypothetical protein